MNKVACASLTISSLIAIILGIELNYLVIT